MIHHQTDSAKQSQSMEFAYEIRDDYATLFEEAAALISTAFHSLIYIIL